MEQVRRQLAFPGYIRLYIITVDISSYLENQNENSLTYTNHVKMQLTHVILNTQYLELCSISNNLSNPLVI